jgi:superfamily I DNA/RNA helicase
VRALTQGADGVDPPNGLLLLGDGAQRIYAGGFTLRQAGVEVRGRTSVLRVNYRNTDGIIGAALAATGNAEVEDLDERFRRGDEVARVERTGPPPLLVEATDADGQARAVVASIRELAETGDIGTGDVAVLVPAKWLADLVVKQLKAARVPHQSLENYDGHPNDGVKVGTYHRGKGLEFKAVFLPGLSKRSFPRPAPAGASEAEAAEAHDLQLSQLFVAMTRARDQLVVLYDGEPAEVIAASADRFRCVTA